MAPQYPGPGRGECIDACAQAGTWVFAPNPAAWVGVALCVALLLTWLNAKAQEWDETEEAEDGRRGP